MPRHRRFRLHRRVPSLKYRFVGRYKRKARRLTGLRARPRFGWSSFWRGFFRALR